jgi:hypothetical protein
MRQAGLSLGKIAGERMPCGVEEPPNVQKALRTLICAIDEPCARWCCASKTLRRSTLRASTPAARGDGIGRVW